MQEYKYSYNGNWVRASLPDDETAIGYLEMLGQVGDEVLVIECGGEVIWRRATEVYSGLLWQRSISLELQAVIAGARGNLGAYRRLMSLHHEVKRMARWMDREAGMDLVDSLAEVPPKGRDPMHSREFQMMLARIIYRHGKGLDISHTVSGARDLLARRGVLSVLRDGEEPEDDNSALINEDSPLGEILRAHVETITSARDVLGDMGGRAAGGLAEGLTELLRGMGAEVQS